MSDSGFYQEVIWSSAAAWQTAALAETIRLIAPTVAPTVFLKSTECRSYHMRTRKLGGAPGPSCPLATCRTDLHVRRPHPKGPPPTRACNADLELSANVLSR